MTGHRPLQTRASAARGRLLLWCGLVVLLLQLFAAVGHAHRGDSDSDLDAPDCVACSVQAQGHAAPPGARPAAVATTWSRVPVASALDVATPLPMHVSALLPQPHAPPAASSLS